MNCKNALINSICILIAGCFFILSCVASLVQFGPSSPIATILLVLGVATLCVAFVATRKSIKGAPRRETDIPFFASTLVAWIAAFVGASFFRALWHNNPTSAALIGIVGLSMLAYGIFETKTNWGHYTHSGKSETFNISYTRHWKE